MTAAVALAFVHHAAAFMVFAVLTVELILMKQELTLGTARALLRMDTAYGISALVLLLAGFTRVFHTEKGAGYYFHSAPFLIKLALFIVVGLVSIYPTVQFLRWRHDLKRQQVPVLADATRRKIRMIVHIELTALLIIMLCAAMMARGIGFIG